VIDETGYDRALAESRAALAQGTGIDGVLTGLRAAGFSRSTASARSAS
jgi:hypothetical protein